MNNAMDEPPIPTVPDGWRRRLRALKVLNQCKDTRKRTTADIYREGGLNRWTDTPGETNEFAPGIESWSIQVKGTDDKTDSSF
jgi:hypothetical protein